MCHPETQSLKMHKKSYLTTSLFLREKSSTPTSTIDCFHRDREFDIVSDASSPTYMRTMTCIVQVDKSGESLERNRSMLGLGNTAAHF